MFQRQQNEDMAQRLQYKMEACNTIKSRVDFQAAPNITLDSGLRKAILVFTHPLKDLLRVRREIPRVRQVPPSDLLKQLFPVAGRGGRPCEVDRSRVRVSILADNGLHTYYTDKGMWATGSYPRSPPKHGCEFL